jgi:hypothetical protein
MFIPKLLKVRVESSRNPETIPLGYVTYIDEKGVLRKKVSWENWGDSFLGDFENIPRTGYKLERIVQRSSDWFGSGRNMFRIEHPCGFHFEITANNFGEICRESSIVKGIVQDECILAWDLQNLALIPCSTETYKEHSKHTETIVGGSIKPKDLVLGSPYNDRNGNFVGFYVGRHSVLEYDNEQTEECKGSMYRRLSFGSVENPWRYNTSVKFRMIHVFVQGYSSSFSESHFTEPKMYACEKPESMFSEIYFKQEELQKCFNRYRHIHIIPENLRGSVEQIIITEWISKIIHENLDERNRAEKITIDWKTFPKNIL